jgi:hypothetical protein
VTVDRFKHPERMEHFLAASVASAAKGPGQQLPMFMSAREITTQYAPNEADRFFHGTDISVARASGVRMRGGPDPREGQGTFRSRRTDDVVNEVNRGPRLAADKREVARRGGEVKPYYRGFRDLRGPWAHPETDEQMYQRKLDEATNTKRGKVVGRGRVVSLPTLTEDIKAKGVTHPIALGQHESPSGRPSIAGGHHRVAVMQHLNPDQLLPVVHVKDVTEANESGH